MQKSSKENSLTKTSGEKNVKTERPNFMVPFTDHSNVLKKREDFAVSLRKQKTKKALDQKRRRFAQPIATDGDSYSIYEGHPEWKKGNYEP